MAKLSDIFLNLLGGTLEGLSGMTPAVKAKNALEQQQQDTSRFTSLAGLYDKFDVNRPNQNTTGGIMGPLTEREQSLVPQYEGTPMNIPGIGEAYISPRETSDQMVTPTPGGGYSVQHIPKQRGGKTIINRPTPGSFDSPVMTEEEALYSKTVPRGTRIVKTPRIASGEAAELGDFSSLLDEIQNVRNNYDPNFVGMTDAPLTALKQATGYKAEPKAAAFRSSLAAINNKLLNLLSGAAISPAEYERLLEQLPNKKRSDVDFVSTLNKFENSLKTTISNRKKGFSDAGYRSLGGGAQNKESGTPTLGSDPLGVL